MIQSRVIAEFRTELERSKQPGYVSRYDDDYDDDIDVATIAGTEDDTCAPASSAGLPPGSFAEPGQSQPPAPHILPPVPAASGGTPSTGGPHFTTPPSHESTRESRDALPKRQPPRNDFGVGIF